jgi:hypothetical protein
MCSEVLELHCIGGFAVTQHYGFERPTGDIDVWDVVPNTAKAWLQEFAGEGSDLHRKHRLYLQIVSSTTLPESYADRLIPLWPDEFSKLRLFVPDRYDLALSKVERNADVDIEDLKHLAEDPAFDSEVLKRRYEEELRPFLHGPASRHDLTIRLWLDVIAELRSNDKK